MAGSFQNVFELDKDRLRGFGPEINQVFVAFKGAGEALEHQVEGPGLGEVAAAAIGAGLDAIFDRQLVCTVARFAGPAIDHGVAKGLFMPAGLPDRAIHDDRSIHADHVLAFTNVPAPPKVLEVAFEFDSERAVIPKPIETPIDFGGLENEASALAETDDLFHAWMRGLFHK